MNAPRTYAQHTHLVRPFLPLLGGDVLEIGPDAGDLACLLAETANAVTMARGDEAALRQGSVACRDRPNIRVVAANDLQPQAGQVFDAVVMADPLACPWSCEGPAGLGRLANLLERARRCLKPDGVLLFAVDNRMSLRQFAGDGETGTHPALFSLEGVERPDGYRLPGRRELRDLLARIGLPFQDWWFPFPDHRVPHTLIAERGLDPAHGLDIAGMIAGSVRSDPRRPEHAAFSMQRAWSCVAENGLVADLAPAFLVAASAGVLPPRPTLALHYGHPRSAAFCKEVAFEAEAGAVAVRRRPLHAGDRDAADGLANVFPDEPLRTGRSWQARLDPILARDGWTVAEVAAWAGPWCEAVRATYGDGAALHLGSRLPGRAIDASPRNLVVDDGGRHFIDEEWDVGEPFPFAWLLVRSLVHALDGIDECAPPAAGTARTLTDLVLQVAEAMGLAVDPETLAACLARESRLQSTASGTPVALTPEGLSSIRLRVRSPLSERHAEALRALSRAEAKRADLEARCARQDEELLTGRLAASRELRRLAEREAGLTGERDRLAAELARMREDRARPPHRPRSALARVLARIFAARPPDPA